MQIVGWMEFLDVSNSIMFLLCIGGGFGVLILYCVGTACARLFRRKKPPDSTPDKETVV